MPFVDTLKLVGKTIADKYAVESVVGEGGFATVYRATHLLWKRPVALKVFKALGDFSEENRQRLLDEFVQEGALLADLSARSAAIVQARDIAMLTTAAGEHVPYMVLEWLDGATLEAVLADEKARGLAPRSLKEAVLLLDPAAEALALAHRKGIAHRDVKPGNLFILGEPRGEATVKLLDFGIAKVVSDMQKVAGTFAKTSGLITSFTPAYGAPEQFSRSHGSTGPWTDVFSLALVLVEVMTGRDPLEGDDFVQLAVTSANPNHRPTPRALGADVSDAIEAVFARAVEVAPSSRWQTAGEFWSALRAALELRGLRETGDDVRLGPLSEALGPGGRGKPALLNPRSTDGTERALVVQAGAAIGVSQGLPPTFAPDAERRAVSPRLWTLVAGAAVLALGAAGAVALSQPKRAVHGAASAPRTAPAGLSATTAAAGSTADVPAAVPVGEGATCPEGMIAIPGGSFFMGSDESLSAEKPAHQVVLTPYCIDRFEVTAAKYRACSDAGRCKRAGLTNDWERMSETDRRTYDPLCNERDMEKHANHPINCVDWEMSDKFCHEKGGRLPTEAEWEFAARGPDGRKYPWGDDDPSPGLLNACGSECVAWAQKSGINLKAMYDADDGFPNTAPVGSFPKGASRFGVQDVVGNVWEWVADWFAAYQKGEQTSPSGPEQGNEKVIRGGAWNGSFASWVRPTFRYKDAPGKRSYGIGFRCAK